MTAQQLTLLALLLLSFPLSLAEMALLYTLWPPYIRALARAPAEAPGLPAGTRLDGADSGEIKLRALDTEELLFRRTFGFGRGRLVYAGRVTVAAGEAPRVTVGPAPSGYPVIVAVGAFGGLTFGGGSILVGLVFAALFALITRANKKSAAALAREQGVAALSASLQG